MPPIRLSASCAVASLVICLSTSSRVSRAQPSPIDGCAEEMFLDRRAPDADRTFAWNYSFATDPERCIIVRVGQTVTWQGNFGDHPLDADEGDRPNPINDHAAGVVRFDQPGTFGFRCNYHLEMRGAVLVVPAPPPVPWAGPAGTAGLAALTLGLVALASAATTRRTHRSRNMLVPNSEQPLTRHKNRG